MIDTSAEVVKWMHDNPEGFVVIWDVRYARTMKTTYRKIQRKCTLPLRATKTGHVKRIKANVPYVVGAIITPDIMYYLEPEKFLVYIDKKTSAKFEGLYEHVRSKGIPVEVKYLD